MLIKDFLFATHLMSILLVIILIFYLKLNKVFKIYEIIFMILFAPLIIFSSIILFFIHLLEKWKWYKDFYDE